jgi:hypothetical protein
MYKIVKINCILFFSVTCSYISNHIAAFASCYFVLCCVAFDHHDSAMTVLSWHSHLIGSRGDQNVQQLQLPRTHWCSLLVDASFVKRSFFFGLIEGSGKLYIMITGIAKWRQSQKKEEKK